MDDLTPLSGPELVFGLVGAVGTDLQAVEDVLASELAKVRYSTVRIRVSRLLHELDRYQALAGKNYSSEYERIKDHMTAGTELRTLSGSGDVMAMLAVSKLRQSRVTNAPDCLEADEEKPLERTAFIIQSLKHPAEIELLRRVYGRAFHIISAYSPRQTRVQQLAARIAASQNEPDGSRFRNQAEELVQTDEREDKSLGQSVRDSFPLGDFFVDARTHDGLKNALARFIRLLFGHPFETPTKDEFAMFHAYAAGLRSSDLGRQVGVAITNCDGNIVAVGCNEVPKFGGGVFWAGDEPDFRDFRKGYDSSVHYRRLLLGQALERLRSIGWQPGENAPSDADSLIEQQVFHGTQLQNLLEFGRSVHAEMAALSEAAHRGLSVQSGSMYTTTFPCHLCARHIISSGVKRVVYIEPYPKSLAQELYKDMIEVDPGVRPSDKVSFEPFVGVAPSLYLEAFRALERKQPDGKVVEWIEGKAEPKLRRYVPSYLLIENIVLGRVLPERLRRAGVSAVTRK
jgi:deoxycytidylate deaminase